VTPGVGCGVAIVEGRRLLLVKRLRAPEAGCWNLPGGRVEFGERAADAARREAAEELGVEVEILAPLGYVEMLSDGQHWLSPIFQGRIVQGAPVNAEPEKHEAFLWADLDAPPAPLALAARVAVESLR